MLFGGRVFRWMVGITGVLALLIALGINHFTTPLKGGVKTLGHVSSVKLVVDRGSLHGRNVSRYDYLATYTFTASDGTVHEVAANGSDPRPRVVGSTRTVSYIPIDPDHARVLEPSTNLATWVWLGIGAFLLLISAACRLAFGRDRVGNFIPTSSFPAMPA